MEQMWHMGWEERSLVAKSWGGRRHGFGRWWVKQLGQRDGGRGTVDQY